MHHMVGFPEVQVKQVAGTRQDNECRRHYGGDDKGEDELVSTRRRLVRDLPVEGRPGEQKT